MKFTNKSIAAAKPGDILRDHIAPGLHVRVSPRKKCFYLYFRTKAKVERRPRLGTWPSMTIADAREVAAEMLKAVARNQDPMVERMLKADAPTVAQLCTKYLKDYAVRKKSCKEDQRLIDKIIKPKLGKMRVEHVDYEAITKLRAGLKATPYQANRVLSLCSKMFNLAEKWKFRPNHSNPCRHVQRYREQKRRRIMDGTEATAIAAALNRYAESRPASVAFLYILILSGARKGEIAAARWEWLEGSTLQLPDSKTGAKTIYLPPQVMAIIEKLPRSDNRTMLEIKDPTALWKIVRQEAGCPDLRMHDLRRTFASAGLMAGYSLGQIGELLGHKSTQTTAGYAYLQPAPAEAAVKTIADRLEEMMSPTSKNSPP